MSVIQKIRDKYARWAVIAIAVSLIGFLLMDAFAGRTGLFSNKQTSTIGKVNGNTIEAQDFMMKVQNEEQAEAKQGEVTDERRQQIISGLWDQEVNNIIMNREYQKLGLSVGDKELKDILYGSNPPEDLKQRFTDPKTGVFNAVAAQQFVSSIKKSGSQDAKTQLAQYEESLKTQKLIGKYMSLLTNTIYFPKWFIEKRNADNSLLAKAAYVSIPYATIADSTVKVSDNEIEDYIKEHKKDFEQKEETRTFDYIVFNAAPSASDSQAVRTSLLDIKGQFAAAADPKIFLSQQGSNIDYFDGYVGKS
ncbi:MAG TPA: SurA N-terminal domain-containing protein, partial [Flavisolibacter sp.]|nr:SurA N-terminal domain-containing protein [Flavisolibacter sp.]